MAVDIDPRSVSPPYVKQTWTDNVTPVDATRMTHIEDGILSASSSVDLRYNGDWIAGSYSDGDIVVYQGVSYMAVKPTSAAPVAWPRPTPQATYGTSLPSSPYDGQEAVLVDSVTAPTYTWRFRFNASSASAYKWEFIGGAALTSYFATSQPVAAVGTWVPGSPSLIVPRAGDYQVGMWATVTPSGNCTFQLAVTIDATNPLTNTVSLGAVTVTGFAMTIGRGNIVVTLAASATLQHLYWNNLASQPWNNRNLSLLPVRVS